MLIIYFIISWISGIVSNAVQPLNTLSKSYKISNLIVTTPVNGIEESKKAVYTDTEISEIEKHLKLTIQFVEGGNTRQSSVYNGLNKIFQSSWQKLKKDL